MLGHTLFWSALMFAFSALPVQAEVVQASPLHSKAWQPLRWAIGLESETDWLIPDDARRLWGEKSIAGGGLSVAYQGLTAGEQGALGIDFSVISAARQFTNHLGGTSRMSSTRLLVGASYAYSVARWFAPYLRVAGGTGENTLKMNEYSAEMNDSVWLWEGRAGAGIFLRTMGWHLGRSADSLVFAIVGRLEGGYILGTDASYHLQTNMRFQSSTPINTIAIPVGTVANRSPYLRVSVGVGF
jgi:hypothetical protein